MPAQLDYAWICKISVLAAMLSVLMLGWHSGEQTDSPPPQRPTRLYFGTEACAQCHTNPPPGSQPVLCRCTEYPIWRDRDKHRNAYSVLQGPRGRQMAEILGIDVTARDAGCIQCHAVAVPADPALTHSSFKIEDGVSCAVCHGSYREWVSRHGDLLERDAWRKLSRTDKEEKFGMTDLWDPAKRTRLCASCHIGDAAENKFVTHEMYAAGHPPLPGFELATFSEAMPRHWELLSEKDKAVQRLLQFDETRLEQVELVLVSTAASFRAAMNLIASQAKQCIESDNPSQSRLDLANFDCHACHHELKVPSWRAKRGYGSTAGRPMPRSWPTALIEVAIVHGDRDESTARAELTSFHAKWRALQDAFGARPLGDSKAIADASTALEAWANQLVQKLQRATYRQNDARRLLQQIASKATTDVVDFDSARQMAWAFRTIYAQVQPKPANHSAIESTLAQLEKQLSLALPSGTNREIMQELPITLNSIGDYDPEKFKVHLAVLGKLIE